MHGRAATLIWNREHKASYLARIAALRQEPWQQTLLGKSWGCQGAESCISIHKLKSTHVLWFSVYAFTFRNELKLERMIFDVAIIREAWACEIFPVKLQAFQGWLPFP